MENGLHHSVRFFRELGFFEEHHGLPDEVVADLLIQRHAEEWGTGIHPDDELADLLLLSYDRRRVWWDDTEADVCADNDVYVETLTGWGTISREAFQPEQIDESWESETGPIRVTFAARGRQVSLAPAYVDDWLDLAILVPINRLIAETGIQLALYEPFDQTAFIVALMHPERKRLERERGWRFARL